VTERDLQRIILEYLSFHPKVGFATKYNNIQNSKSARRSKFQPRGIPDIIGNLKNGQALYIEVKLPTGRRCKIQDAFLEKRLAENCIAFVATSVKDVQNGLTPPQSIA